MTSSEFTEVAVTRRAFRSGENQYLINGRRVRLKDVAQLTAVYAAMKPKEAAAVFEEMDPAFAAGFLGRMKPDAAAQIVAGLSPGKAYSISVILAGRNVGTPTE